VGTGVRIEAHPDPEPEVRELIAHAGESADALGGELEAYWRDELVYVRAIAFVDVELDGASHRWEWTPSLPEAVGLGRSATSRLVDLARNVEASTRDRLLVDARVSGLRVGRWEIESAPRRIELDASLHGQLVLD